MILFILTYHNSILQQHQQLFDADNSYTFDVKGIDNNGVLVPGNMPFSATIEWFTTTGTIAPVNQTSAQLSPTTNGLNTISACYGVICTDYVIDIDSGVPVQLFASLSQTSDINSVTINADETVTAYAYAVDQHNNLVTTEVISFIPSNGTIDANGVFSPYAHLVNKRLLQSGLERHLHLQKFSMLQYYQELQQKSCSMDVRL